MRNKIRRGGSALAPFTGALALAAAVMALGAAGCFQSTTQPENAANLPTSTAVPSLDELQSKAGFSDDQATALAPAHRAWAQAEAAWASDTGSIDEPPVLDFLAESARVLDREQLGRLAGTLHRFEAGQLGALGMEEGRLPGLGGRGPGGIGAPGERPGDHGPGRGGPGRRGPGHMGPGPGRPGPGDPGTAPWDRLGLSEEQIVQLHEARRAMMEAVRGLVEQYRAGTITPDELEAGIEAARVDFEAAIQSILTAEQYAALLEFRRARLIEHLERRLGTFDQHVASRVATLDRILDLSDTQAADVQTILANMRPAMETVLAGLRDGSLSVLDAKEALRQLQADTDAAIRALLTPEQAELFDRLTAFRRHFPGCRP